MIDYSGYAGSFATHAIYFLSGSTAISIISHAVNTFPMPKSEIGRWFLGIIQYAVGQRSLGSNTLNGHSSVMVPKAMMEQAKEIIAAAPIVAKEVVTVIPVIPVIPGQKE